MSERLLQLVARLLDDDYSPAWRRHDVDDAMLEDYERELMSLMRAALASASGPIQGRGASELGEEA